MMFKKSKKGFVVDTIVGTAALFIVVLVIALVALILFNFNDAVQNNAAVTDGAKQVSSDAEGTLPAYLGYGFMAMFIGFFIYTIITAILINNIHPIFWIVGFILVLISTVITSAIKMVFGVVETVSVLAPYIAAIPGATWYFYGIEIYNVIWMAIQLTIIYFAYER